jgi:Arc/MetJ family transcription regulator
MGRTNIDIDDHLIDTVMVRYQLSTKREAVDYALRHLAGIPQSTVDIAQLFGAFPHFEVPSDHIEYTN